MVALDVQGSEVRPEPRWLKTIAEKADTSFKLAPVSPNTLVAIISSTNN
jgi:hypothetical protein